MVKGIGETIRGAFSFGGEKIPKETKLASIQMGGKEYQKLSKEDKAHVLGKMLDKIDGAIDGSKSRIDLNRLDKELSTIQKESQKLTKGMFSKKDPAAGLKEKVDTVRGHLYSKINTDIEKRHISGEGVKSRNAEINAKLAAGKKESPKVGKFTKQDIEAFADERGISKIEGHKPKIMAAQKLTEDALKARWGKHDDRAAQKAGRAAEKEHDVGGISNMFERAEVEEDIATMSKEYDTKYDAGMKEVEKKKAAAKDAVGAFKKLQVGEHLKGLVEDLRKNHELDGALQKWGGMGGHKAVVDEAISGKFDKMSAADIKESIKTVLTEARNAFHSKYVGITGGARGLKVPEEITQKLNQAESRLNGEANKLE